MKGPAPPPFFHKIIVPHAKQDGRRNRTWKRERRSRMHGGCLIPLHMKITLKPLESRKKCPERNNLAINVDVKLDVDSSMSRVKCMTVRLG